MVPQLLEMRVRFFTPLRCRAAIRFSGLPHRPKPPLMITAPSWMSRTASSALSDDLVHARLALHHQGDALAAADAERRARRASCPGPSSCRAA